MALNTNKNVKLYYSIKEVAAMFDIRESTLRFWETEFPHLKPKTVGQNVRQYTEKRHRANSRDTQPCEGARLQAIGSTQDAQQEPHGRGQEFGYSRHTNQRARRTEGAEEAARQHGLSRVKRDVSFLKTTTTISGRWTQSNRMADAIQSGGGRNPIGRRSVHDDNR